jgi:hypothetical protein
MLQRSSHTPTQEIKQAPSSPRKRVKLAWSRGLVKMSASWSFVGTWIKVIFPFSIVSQKMVSHFYVLGYGKEHWVLCNTYGTGAITLKWDMGILLTKVTHVVRDLKELRATTSCSNIHCLGSGLSNTQLFAGRPRHQRRSQKLASSRSGLPIQPTPGKILVWKNHEAPKKKTQSTSKSGVWQKYLKIHFTTCRCEVLGDAWKWAHRHIE